MISLVGFVVLAELGLHGRPRECLALEGGHGANVWERAKVPALQRYCDVLASASTKLVPGSRRIADVMPLADEADTLVPGHAAPLLLKGRALVELARYPEALVVLRAARDRDPHALDDPGPLLAWARALAFTGDDQGARAAYQALLPRAEALPLSNRGVAYLGAGMLSLHLGPAAVEGAVAILRQARRDSQDVLQSAAAYALALALDRAGNAAEATAVLTDEGTGGLGLLHEPRVRAALGPEGTAEEAAMRALALDVTGKRLEARALWGEYLAAVGEHGVWAAHAKAALGGRAAGGAKR